MRATYQIEDIQYILRITVGARHYKEKASQWNNSLRARNGVQGLKQ